MNKPFVTASQSSQTIIGNSNNSHVLAASLASVAGIVRNVFQPPSIATAVHHIVSAVTVDVCLVINLCQTLIMDKSSFKLK
jgi:hypothetical protein